MPTKPSESGYLLGVSDAELDRLRFQHGVWKPITDAFFDRLHVRKRWKCLDVGSGPGFVTFDLRKRVGPGGEVTALDTSSFYLNRLQLKVKHKGWNNIRCVNESAEEADLPHRHFDFIFCRWVLNFVPDPRKFITRLISFLRPKGIIAFQDYWYEGLSFYPRGTALDRLADIVRGYYKSGGGDPYATGAVPGILRRQSVKLLEFIPHQLSGNSRSDVFEWAHRFFSIHIPLMAEKGLISAGDSKKLLQDFKEFRSSSDSMFFSPIVVDIAGERSP